MLQTFKIWFYDIQHYLPPLKPHILNYKNHPAAISRVICVKACTIDIREVSVKFLQRRAFIDVNASSIGLKSGEYGSR